MVSSHTGPPLCREIIYVHRRESGSRGQTSKYNRDAASDHHKDAWSPYLCPLRPGFVGELALWGKGSGTQRASPMSQAREGANRHSLADVEGGLLAAHAKEGYVAVEKPAVWE